MARKIVRDIERKTNNTISLQEGRKPAKPPSGRRNVVDISGVFGKRVLTGMPSDGLKDMESVNTSPSGKADFVLYRVENRKNEGYDKVGEVIRMAASGILIMFVINLVNVFQNGILIKDIVLSSASAGYENLMEAGTDAKRSDYKSAENLFGKAEENFAQAVKEISFLQVNRSLFFAKEQSFGSINNLLEAADKLSSAGRDLLSGIDSLRRLPSYFIQSNGRALITGKNDVSSKSSITNELKKDLEYMETAIFKINAAENNLSLVSEEIMPPPFREKFISLKDKISGIAGLLRDLQEEIPAVLKLLGDRYPHRFLVLLQNDTEARPTGGFIGSYIIVDINDGYITKVDFNDVYDSDGQLKEDIVPPPDIAKVSKNWRLRDSNYSPDFALSGEKAAWFLQKEKGPSVDSVIAVNQSFIAELFSITGPINLEGFSYPVTGENFQLILSYLIESKFSGAQNPKAVLGQVIPVFMKKLFSEQNIGAALPMIFGGMRDKSIMAYSRDGQVQKLFEGIGLGGKVIPTGPNDDYLNVIISSIGGNKSDLYMKQRVTHNTLVLNDGTLVDAVSVKRAHTWSEKNLIYIKDILSKFGFTEISDQLIDILGRGKNKSFVKVYVPKDSTLIDADGIDMKNVDTIYDSEINKTYFMFEMEVPFASDKEVTLSYKLPYRLDLGIADSYRFFAQSQPSINKVILDKNIFVKPGISFIKEFPSSLKKDENGTLKYSDLLTGDLYLSALIGR